MKPLSHRQVEAMLESERPLSSTMRLAVQHHIADCAACTAYKTVLARLESGAWQPHILPRTSAAKKQQLITQINTRIRRKRRMNYMLQSAKFVAWGVGVLLVIFGLSTLMQNTTDVSIPLLEATSLEPSVVTEPATGSMTVEETQLTAVPPTPTQDINVLISKLPTGIALNWDILTEVDLDCDGRKEIVYGSRFSGQLGEGAGGNITYAYYSLDVAQEEISGHAIGDQVLEYWADAPYNGRFPSNTFFSLVTVGQCEQVIAISGWLPKVEQPEYLQLFRWDGMNLVSIFKGAELLVQTDETASDASVVMTTRRIASYMTNKNTCEWQYTNYSWDGKQFVVDSHYSKLEDCAGNGA